MYRPAVLPSPMPDEHALVVLHRHWFVFFKRILQIFLLTILPVAITWLLFTFTAFAFVSGTASYVLVVMGLSLYSLFLLLLLYGYWIDYALDIFIVSNKRVVDIEQYGLFNRTVAEQRLYRIQDVTYEVRGALKTFLKYGNVYIQTAGEKARFVFEDVPHPDRIAELILREVDAVHSQEPDTSLNPKTVLDDQKPVPHHQHPPTGQAVR